jgi:hypothetical protein
LEPLDRCVNTMVGGGFARAFNNFPAAAVAREELRDPSSP